MAQCTIVNNPSLENCCVVSVAFSGTNQKEITLTLDNGQEIIGAFTDNDTTYSLSYTNGDLTFTPSVGAPTTFNIIGDLISSDSGNIITIGSDGKLFVQDTPTAMINNPAGHVIASYVNEAAVSFDISETETEITGATLSAANILTINYRNETGVSASTTVDLSTLAADVKVLSLQYDDVTNTIQITNTDGTTNSVVLTDIIDVITNALTMTGNTLESTVNGVSDSVNVITSTSLSKIGTDLVMAVNGVSASIPILSITDGSDTKLTAGTNVTVTGTGTVGNPYVIASTDTDTTYTATISGNIITLTGSDGTVQNVTLPAQAVPDGSETKVTAGTGITITGSGTTSNPYVVTGEIPNGSETKIVAGTGTTVVGAGTAGFPYVINAIPADGSETKVVAGPRVSVTGTGTTASPYVITSTAADGSETKVTGGTGITISGTGTTASPYVITNTVTDTNTEYSFYVVGNNLNIVDTDGGFTSIAIPCSCTGAETKVNAGTGVTVTGSGTVASPYVINSSGVSADGSETKVQAGTMMDITGTGTTANPYVVNSIVAKVNAGTNVTVTGDGTTANPYVINSSATSSASVTGVAITGTNNKTITISLSDGTTVAGNFTDLQGSGGPSADPNNILVAGTDGGPWLSMLSLVSTNPNNQVSIGTDGKLYVPSPGCCPTTLEAYLADPEIGIHAIDLTLADGTILQALTAPRLSEDNPGLNDLRIGTDGGLYYDLSVQADYIALANKVVTGAAVTGTTNKTLTITFANGTNVTAPFTDLDTTTAISAGTNVTVTGTGTSTDPYVINSTATGGTADGSETKITVGAGLTLSGTGTTADPYVLTNTEIDTNTTYDLTISGTNITLTGSDGSTDTIALPTGTADTNTTYTLSVSGTNIVLTGSDGVVNTIAVPCACDGSETKVTAGTGTSVTGAGTTASPYVINSTVTADGSETKITASTGISISGTGTTADPYVLTSNAVADGSETKINVGTGLTITGAGTTASPYVLTNTVTDTNTTYTASVSGNSLTLTPSSGTAQTVTLPTPDGSETIVTGAGNVTVSGDGTTASPYVVNSDDTFVTSVDVSGTSTKTVTIGLSDGTTVADTFTDNDTTYSVAVSGNDLTLTPSTGTAQTVTLPTGDGSETKVTAGTGVTVTGTGTTASPYVVSSSVTVDGSETKVQTTDPVLSVTGSGTTASPYNISYTGPTVLYKYCAYITGPGVSNTQPTVQEIYDNIPGGVGQWNASVCDGFFTAFVPGYSFNRANTVVTVTPVTQWAGISVAGQGNGGVMSLGVTNGASRDGSSPPPGCDFVGTNSFVVYFEATVYENNPQP